MPSQTPQDIARAYLRRGWAPISVPFRSKNPARARWQALRLTEEDLAAAFPGGPQNIGVLLGAPSSGLADIDLDVPLARLLAERCLPRTDASFGRTSALGAHRLYVVTGVVATKRWRDPTVTDDDRATLLELRLTGAQTLFPGSTHPGGEVITWDADGEPAPIAASTLLTAAARLAATVLLARHWPGVGARHDAALALAGGLLRAGWSTEVTTDFLATVAIGAGDDEPSDRARAAVSSASAMESGKPTTGWPTLSRLLDPRVVTTVVDWLSITDAPSTITVKSSYEEFSAGRPDPEQIARTIPVPPFPLGIFPDQVRVYLERGATAVGCPPDLLALPFLGYVGSAIGRTRLIEIKPRWRRKATLWTGVVAASGEGKSPADSYARAALDELQNEADARYQEQLVAYRAEQARWKATDPTTRGEEPASPTYEHWYSTDATVEALAPMLQHNAGLALACDELTAWARGCNAYKRGGNDRQKYLEIWNGRPLKVDRKTQGVIFVKDPVLGIIGGIQPERLHEMTREASAHDGLLPRFVWTYPDVTPTDWSWGETGMDDLETMVDLFRSLRRPPSLTGPLILRPHPAARERWKTWYDETHRAKPTLPPLAREFASKLPPQLATLWLLLCTLWAPTDISGVASAARLDDAIELIEYLRAHARRVLVHFGTAAPQVDAGLAGRVRAILERAAVEEAETGGWISRTEIWTQLHRNADASSLDGALAALQVEGVAESREVPTGTNKRTEWRLVRNKPTNADETIVTWEDDIPVESANCSYEEFTTSSGRASRACYACGSECFTPDGVCLMCHPRPVGHHMESGT
jgi:hypothetical protein